MAQAPAAALPVASRPSRRTGGIRPPAAQAWCWPAETAAINQSGRERSRRTGHGCPGGAGLGSRIGRRGPSARPSRLTCIHDSDRNQHGWADGQVTAEMSEGIALFTRDLAGGGVGRVIVNLAKGFAERGHASTSCSRGGAGPISPSSRPGVRVIDFGVSRTLAACRASSAICGASGRARCSPVATAPMSSRCGPSVWPAAGTRVLISTHTNVSRNARRGDPGQRSPDAALRASLLPLGRRCDRRLGGRGGRPGATARWTANASGSSTIPSTPRTSSNARDGAARASLVRRRPSHR